MATYLGNGSDETFVGVLNAVDLFKGAGGNDDITGGSGNDLLNGGAGDDVLRGGHGDDVVYGGEGDDSITGGDDNDIVSGGDGDDVVNGQWGDDRVRGGAGNDRLIGGDGNDRFYFNVADGAGKDTIVDFTSGTDLIVVEGAGLRITAITDVKGVAHIFLSNGDEIVVLGHNHASLHASDFAFTAGADGSFVI